MAYTRPDFDAADATWLDATAYTRPDFDAADATWYVAPAATYEAILADDSGLPLQPAMYAAHLHEAYLSDEGGVLGAPSVFAAHNFVAWVEAASPLGAVEFLAAQNWVAWVEDGGLPLPFSGVAFVAPMPYVDAMAPIRYSMELVAPDGSSIRAPISSWQATLQTGDQCYASCVVPACGDYLDALNDAVEFIIWRAVQLRDGSTVEMQAVRCPLDTLTLNRGAVSHSASLAGYFDAYPAVTNPHSRYDRELQGVQIVTNYPSGARLRAQIDWLLQPGQRARWGSTSFVAGYINYYANGTFDYMDVGYRQ